MSSEAEMKMSRDRRSESLRAADGQSEVLLSFEAFYTAEYERLARFLVLQLRQPEEAEDLAQEAMIRLLERWPTAGEIQDPRAYLYRVAFNMLGRWRRRAAAARRFVERSRPLDVWLDEPDVALQIALRKLPPKDRAAVVLVVWLQFSSGDAAAILDIKESSVRSRVHRGRIALRRELGMESDHE